MRNIFFILVVIVFVSLFALARSKTTPEVINQSPQITGSSSPSQSSINNTDFPLTVPSGFSLSIFAKGLGAPRILAFDPTGTLLTSIPSQGKVVSLPAGNTVIAGLNQPHGFAFFANELYIAETDKVSVFEYNQETKKAVLKKKLFDLPGGGGHSTRTILIHQNKLYTSIGSSCNVCNESDNRRAKVFVSDLDGTNFKEFSTGLRNSVFMTINPSTMQIWATEMGRDLIGDDIPPDEVNILENGKNYGWPTCYGKNVHDTNFDKSGAGCDDKTPSQVDLQAHSAPLGLAFVPQAWGKEYAGDLLVAYHGSWNRSIPTGYKVVRIHLDANGKSEKTEDFLTGWIQKNNVLGRPVAIVFDKNGIAYISDDKAGVVYKLEKK